VLPDSTWSEARAERLLLLGKVALATLWWMLVGLGWALWLRLFVWALSGAARTLAGSSPLRIITILAASSVIFVIIGQQAALLRGVLANALANRWRTQGARSTDGADLGDQGDAGGAPEGRAVGPREDRADEPADQLRDERTVELGQVPSEPVRLAHGRPELPSYRPPA